jgi:hypothetical protein
VNSDRNETQPHEPRFRTQRKHGRKKKRIKDLRININNTKHKFVEAITTSQMSCKK